MDADRNVVTVASCKFLMASAVAVEHSIGEIVFYWKENENWQSTHDQ